MHRKFDDSFKIIAVDLSVVRGSVADVDKELDIDPSLLSKWRRNHVIIGIRFCLTILRLVQRNRR